MGLTNYAFTYPSAHQPAPAERSEKDVPVDSSELGVYRLNDVFGHTRRGMGLLNAAQPRDPAVAARDGPVAGLLSEQCDVSGHRHSVDGGSGRLERPITRRGLAAPAQTGGGGATGAVRRRENEEARAL